MLTPLTPTSPSVTGQSLTQDCGSATCGCCAPVAPGKNQEKFNLKNHLINLGGGFVVFLAALILQLPFWWTVTLFAVSYLLIGRDVVWKAISNLSAGKLFDEFFLMTVATLGAFAIQQFPEAVGVMLFYKIGEIFQSMALDHSRKSITSLMEIRPDFANLQVQGKLQQVSPEKIQVGDTLVIKPGERVPLDGIVLEGSSLLDTSALTGEAIPKKIEVKDEILSGMVNQGGLLRIRVTKLFSDSTVSKVLNLVENAASKKAATEKFITKFAKYYTPAVVFGALAVAFLPVTLYNIPIFTPLFSEVQLLSEWVYNALIFLVISCPCALVISIPLGFFGGIGAASKKGILVKGSNFLEALNNVDTIVWDKTGTLTQGVFKVTKVIPSDHFSREDILEYAAYAEWYSNHPIARSICEAYPEQIDEQLLSDYQEVPGCGIKAKVKMRDIRIGNRKLLSGIATIPEAHAKEIGVTVYLAVDGVYAGCLVIADEIKADAKSAVQSLKEMGVKRQIMLTGDRKESAALLANTLGLDEVYAELLPQNKVEKVEELIRQRSDPRQRLAFVGDGINDAPALMRSDIGIAMGALGSDAAIEAADIVLMNDEPSAIPTAVKVARRTRFIVWQNIVFALGVKGVFLSMGALGLATMWEAVFADVGVALLAILNSTRVLKEDT